MRKIIYGLWFSLLIILSSVSYANYSFYGPTIENEHLYRIAMRVRPSANLTVQQTMVAIFYANPAAFNLHNLNGLKSGYHLRIPPLDAIARIHPEYALKMVNYHNNIWERGYNRQAEFAAKKIKPKTNHHSEVNLAGTPHKIKNKVHMHKSPVIESEQKEKPLPAKTTLIDLANEQQKSVKSTNVETQTANTDPPLKATTPTENEAVNNQISVTNEKMNGFIQETKQYEQQTSTQLANLQRQARSLEATVNQLNQDLRTLTYHFIQLTAKNKPSNKANYVLDAVKENALALSAGVLTLLLLTYLLARSFRPKKNRVKRYKETAKKDDYDFMSTKESIPSKLDLARAYIDMGDNSSAKATLQEVIEKGNENQQQEARNLLGKMK